MRWAGVEEAWQMSCQVHWDSTPKASPTFFLKTALLRENLHTMKDTHVKNTIQ